MSLTIYQSITPQTQQQTPQQNGQSTSTSLLCGSDRPYQIRKWCGVRRSTWLLTFYVIAYIGYLVGGSYLFGYLEHDNEQMLRRAVRHRKRQFIEEHPSVSPHDLEQLIFDVTAHGLSPLEHGPNATNWNFGQSFLFTVTIVTTIGYGHINPKTAGGKLFCILYCIVGIPFTLVFLSAIVQRLLSPTFRLLSKFLQKLSHIGNLEVRLLHLSLMGFAIFFLVFLIPTVLFWWLETDWTFLDSVYFVFISLTTIGLGDYIPGDNVVHFQYRKFYKVVVGLYLLLGLMFLSLTLTVYYDIPQLNLGLHLHKHRDIFDGDNDRANQRNLNTSKEEISENTTVSHFNETEQENNRETNQLVKK